MDTLTDGKALRRLHAGDSRSDTEMLAPFRAPLHRLFGRWVASHHHVRDFVVAVDHSATTLYGEFLLSGSPRFGHEQVPEPVLLALPVDVRAKEGPKHRFYSDADELGVSSSVLQEQRIVLAPLMLAWMMSNYFPRDFVLAARETAVMLCYDYSVCKSLAGLGGGMTADSYITTALAVDSP